MEADAMSDSARRHVGIDLDGYVDCCLLPRIIALLKENTHQATDKVEEWRQEAELQKKIYIDLNSDINE
jgi:hypothetical protein